MITTSAKATTVVTNAAVKPPPLLPPDDELENHEVGQVDEDQAEDVMVDVVPLEESVDEIWQSNFIKSVGLADNNLV